MMMTRRCCARDSHCYCEWDAPFELLLEMGSDINQRLLRSIYVRAELISSREVLRAHIWTITIHSHFVCVFKQFERCALISHTSRCGARNIPRLSEFISNK